jgi:hypothetical protein
MLYHDVLAKRVVVNPKREGKSYKSEIIYPFMGGGIQNVIECHLIYSEVPIGYETNITWKSQASG